MDDDYRKLEMEGKDGTWIATDVTINCLHGSVCIKTPLQNLLLCSFTQSLQLFLGHSLATQALPSISSDIFYLNWPCHNNPISLFFLPSIHLTYIIPSGHPQAICLL
jgi:hypothetical protein